MSSRMTGRLSRARQLHDYYDYAGVGDCKEHPGVMSKWCDKRWTGHAWAARQYILVNRRTHGWWCPKCDPQGCHRCTPAVKVEVVRRDSDRMVHKKLAAKQLALPGRVRGAP